MSSVIIKSKLINKKQIIIVLVQYSKSRQIIIDKILPEIKTLIKLTTKLIAQKRNRKIKKIT